MKKFFDCNKNTWGDCECTTECKRGHRELDTGETFKGLLGIKGYKLPMTDVEQQGELLKAFLEWYDEDVEYNKKQPHNNLIVSFFASF